MNILLYVITLLMVLAMLTYARLDSFRSFSITQHEFTKYIQNQEREFHLQKANKWYEQTTVSSHQKRHSERIKASPRLSWLSLVDEETRQMNPDFHACVKRLSKALMFHLFGQQEFFQNACQENPYFLEALLEAIEKANLPKKKVSQANDLANLNLGDETLNRAFYQMLKGYSLSSTPEKPPEIDEGEDTADAETQAKEDRDEHQKEEGKISLLDHLTLKNSEKIRVFLAPKALLLVIFEDQRMVDEILEARIQFYLAACRGKDKGEASLEFEQLFRDKVPDFLDPFLDFSVTKVDPRKA